MVLVAKELGATPKKGVFVQAVHQTVSKSRKSDQRGSQRSSSPSARLTGRMSTLNVTHQSSTTSKDPGEGTRA
eukprot:6138097-Prymnesium_polylepis.1